MSSQMMGSSFNMGNTLPGSVNPMMTGPMGGPPPVNPSMIMSQGGGMNLMMTGPIGGPPAMNPGMMRPPGSMAPGLMGPPGAMGAATMIGPMQMGPSMGGPMGGPPFGPGSGQYMANTSRPGMTSVANPPIVSNNIQYGPSYKMQYAARSTADKTAVKYTGFLPLEGVYEEDTCRIG